MTHVDINRTSKSMTSESSSGNLGATYSRTKLFSMAFAVWIISHMLQESVFADSSVGVVRLFRLASLALLFALEIRRLSSYRSADWTMVALLVPFAVSGVISHNTVLFQGLLFCFCARREIDVKAALRVQLIVVAGTLAIIAALSLFGVLGQGSLATPDGGNVRLRSSLGFAWPSRPANYYLTVVLLVVLTIDGLKYRSKVVIGLVLAVAALAVFEFTDSRAPFLITIVVILGYVAPVGLSWDRVRSNAVLVSSIFVVCTTALLLVTVFYDSSNDLMIHLDALLSGRLRYSHAGMQNYPLTLLGSSGINIGDPVVDGYFDSGYLRMLYYWGIIPSILFLGCITLTLYVAASDGNFVLCFLMVLLALHSTVEGRLVLLSYSPFLIYVGPSVYGRLVDRAVARTEGLRVDRR